METIHHKERLIPTWVRYIDYDLGLSRWKWMKSFDQIVHRGPDGRFTKPLFTHDQKISLAYGLGLFIILYTLVWVWIFRR